MGKMFWILLQKQDLILQKLPPKSIHQTAETTSALIGNKMAEKFLKTDASSRNIEEINISPEKREDILNKQGKML